MEGVIRRWFADPLKCLDNFDVGSRAFYAFVFNDPVPMGVPRSLSHPPRFAIELKRDRAEVVTRGNVAWSTRDETLVDDMLSEFVTMKAKQDKTEPVSGTTLVMGPAWARNPSPEVPEDHMAAYAALLKRLGDRGGKAKMHAWMIGIEAVGHGFGTGPLGAMGTAEVRRRKHLLGLTPVGLAPRVNWPWGKQKGGRQDWGSVVVNRRRIILSPDEIGFRDHFRHGASDEAAYAVLRETVSWRQRLGLWRRIAALEAWCSEMLSHESWEPIEQLLDGGPSMPPRLKLKEQAARSAIDAEVAIFALGSEAE